MAAPQCLPGISHSAHPVLVLALLPLIVLVSRGCCAVSAGDDSLPTAQREVEEELGLQLPQEVSNVQGPTLALGHRL